MEFIDKEQQNKIIKLVKSDDRENVEKYAIYIRSNNKYSVTTQTEIEEKKDFLKDICKKNNYNVTYIFIDVGFSGRIDKRLSFDKMLELINDGKINGVITQSIEELIREDFEKTNIILENIKNSGAKIITVNNRNLLVEVSEKMSEKYVTGIKKLAQKIKREEIKKIKNKNKAKER